jgi:MtN3 and saliva related transmembrane protein
MLNGFFTHECVKWWSCIVVKHATERAQSATAYRLKAEAELFQMAGTYMNDLTTMVGFLAGLATTAANLPQVWKTYRNKSAEGLSFRMLLTLAIGVGLWIIYGFLSKSLPLIVTNAVVLLLILSLLGMKLKFDLKPTKD